MPDNCYHDTYGWFRDLDTVPDIVVLECRESVTGGRTVYRVQPLYISSQTNQYTLTYETKSQSGVLINIVNNQMVDDIESQTAINTKPIENPIMETHLQKTKRLLYVCVVCILYICICCC
jgi:hypothetical protein